MIQWRKQSIIMLIGIGIIAIAVIHSLPIKMPAECDAELRYEKSQRSLSDNEAARILYQCYTATAAIKRNSSLCGKIPDYSEPVEKIKMECYGEVAYSYGNGNTKVCDSLSGDMKFATITRREACLREIANQCCRKSLVTGGLPPTSSLNPLSPVCKALAYENGITNYCDYWHL